MKWDLLNDYSFGWNLKSERYILIGAHECEWIPKRKWPLLSYSAIYSDEWIFSEIIDLSWEVTISFAHKAFNHG